MTPQEIFDYKNKWKPGHIVHVHSDLYRTCVIWCRDTLLQHVWYTNRHTNVYQSTFYFENKKDAETFSSKFERWLVNREYE